MVNPSCSGGPDNEAETFSAQVNTYNAELSPHAAPRAWPLVTAIKIATL